MKLSWEPVIQCRGDLLEVEVWLRAGRWNLGEVRMILRDTHNT